MRGGGGASAGWGSRAAGAAPETARAHQQARRSAQRTHHARVKVLAAQVGVTRGGLHLKHPLVDGQQAAAVGGWGGGGDTGVSVRVSACVCVARGQQAGAGAERSPTSARLRAAPPICPPSRHRMLPPPHTHPPTHAHTHTCANLTSKVPPPRSKMRTLCSRCPAPWVFLSRPYAMAAAVGSLMMRRTSSPAIAPASCACAQGRGGLRGGLTQRLPLPRRPPPPHTQHPLTHTQHLPRSTRPPWWPGAASR